MKLGELLKDVRGQRSLRDMERITGLSHTYLSSLEKGVDPRNNSVRLPSLETLKMLSETLNIEFSILMESVGFPQLKKLEQANVELQKRLNDIKEIADGVREFNYPCDKIYNIASVRLGAGEN